MAKYKIGEMLVRAGLIKESDLRIALAQQKTHGGRIGEHLIRINVLGPDKFFEMLALQLGLAYNDLSTPPIPAVVNMIVEKVAMRLQVLPTAFDPRANILTVACGDPLDSAPLQEVARITGKIITPQVCPPPALRRAIEHAYFSVDLNDEGTNEFQLVDIHGRGKTVRVDDDHDLPELGTSELMPLDDADLGLGGEHAPLAPQPMAPAPAPGAKPAPQLPFMPRPPSVNLAAHAPMASWPAGQMPPPAPPKPPSLNTRPGQPPALSPNAVPPKPQPPAAPHNEAGEEALHMVMAIADLLIERGYFTRAELMRTLRK